MTRNCRAWELNDLTVRCVRNMLQHDDIDSLTETGSGTPSEAAMMVRCYELAAMELWDESALIDVATVAGMDDGFTLSGESPAQIQRKISIAIKAHRAPEFMPPPDGIELLYRLGVLVYDELEETVTRFAAIGRYDATAPAPANDTPEQAAPVVAASDEPVPSAKSEGPKFSMTKAGLIAAHEHEWPGIRTDIAGAANNGLNAAKADSRGWFEDIAMQWARAKGRLQTNKETASNLNIAMTRMASLPSQKHTLKG